MSDEKNDKKEEKVAEQSEANAQKQEKASNDKKGNEANTSESADKPKDAKPKKIKLKKRHVPEGKVFIQASYNNTIVTIAEPNGNVISWATSGSSGFKGARKATPYAAQVAAENAAEKAKLYGFEKAHVFVKGVGSGREQAIRGLVSNGIELISISDVTPFPHNGCRKKKQRRV